MVYCGSGTETIFLFMIKIVYNYDPMVYCGSGTETNNVLFNNIL